MEREPPDIAPAEQWREVIELSTIFPNAERSVVLLEIRHGRTWRETPGERLWLALDPQTLRVLRELLVEAEDVLDSRSRPH